MLPDIKYETLPVYGETTKLDQSQKSLLVKCEQPRLKAALEHHRKRRFCITVSVIVASALLIAAILTAYFLLVPHQGKGYQWISYAGQDNEGGAFKESAEVDTSSQTIVHFVSGPRFVTSLYLYQMSLMIVKDSQCYVSEYTDTFEENLSTLQQFQDAGEPIKHKRVVYRLTEKMTRTELVELGGDVAGAFCPEHAVWRMETVNTSLSERHTKPSAVSSFHTPSQSSPSNTAEEELLVSLSGKEEDGSGEEKLQTPDDKKRQKRDASHCVCLLTFRAELYPEYCF